MILVFLIAIVVFVVASSAGVPWPIALIGGIGAPLVLGTVYLSMTGRNAPTGKLTPNDPRTARFLRLLSERFQTGGMELWASEISRALASYEAGQQADAEARVRSTANGVSRHPASTSLIAAWQQAWKDAK